MCTSCHCENNVFIAVQMPAWYGSLKPRDMQIGIDMLHSCNNMVKSANNSAFHEFLRDQYTFPVENSHDFFICKAEHPHDFHVELNSTKTIIHSWNSSNCLFPRDCLSKFK